jgi:AcrR family transcriptional regulator
MLAAASGFILLTESSDPVPDTGSSFFLKALRGFATARARILPSSRALTRPGSGSYNMTKRRIWSLVTNPMRTRLAAPEVREAVLDAAERLLARYGYRKMTIEDLARESGIGKGTTYLHFASKQEVVLSTVDRIVERLLIKLAAVAASTASPAEKVQRMLVERILFRFDSIRGYSQSLDELLRSVRPAYLVRRRKYFAREAAIFASVLHEGTTARELAVTDPDCAARLLVTATNALLPYSLAPKELGRRQEVEEQARGIAELLLEGLRRRP